MTSPFFHSLSDFISDDSLFSFFISESLDFISSFFISSFISELLSDIIDESFMSSVFILSSDMDEFFNAFLIGVTFSFGWTPCVGPVLSSVLAIAASGGDGALQGALLMLVYTLGLALPFLLLALASSWVLQHFAKLKPHMGTLKKIGGALIILMGILLMLGNLNSLASLFH